MSIIPIQTKQNPRQGQGHRYLRSFSELQEKLASGQYLPPQCVEIEQSVLGSMMLDPDAKSRAIEVIGERSIEGDSPFYRDAHTLIYLAITSLDADGEKIDMLTVVERLRKSQYLEDVGGAAYVVELTQKVVTTANVEAHARLILEKHIARELIKTCEEMKLRAYLGEDDTFDLLDSAEGSLFQLSETRHSKSFLDTNQLASMATKDIRILQEHTGDITGIPSGLIDLDGITNGWQKTDLIILAARPSQGKTALALSMARFAALCDEPKDRTGVAIFSLEMGASQLVLRLLCSEAQVDLQKTRKGKLNAEELVKITRAIDKLKTAGNIFIDDTAAITPTELRAKCRRLCKRHNIGLVIVDYLQLMEAGRNMDSREREISYISRSLKKLAKELNIPVIALSQLNRGVETRSATDKRPMLADLRESGAIEQDADLVCFIYRPSTYGIEAWEDAQPTAGTAEIIVGKQRNGPIGNVRVAFRGDYGRFDNHVRIPLFDQRGNQTQSKSGGEW